MDIPKWDACTMDPRAAVRWLECHPSSTGACATALAMLAAAAVPLYLWRRDRAIRTKERIDISRAFAATAITNLTAVYLDIPRARYKLRVLQDAALGWPGIPDTLRQAKLNVPGSLQDALAQLHNYDNAVVAPVGTAITSVNGYNGMVENYWFAASDDVRRFDGGRAVVLETTNGLLDVIGQEIGNLIGAPKAEN